ncbi:MAG: hypothetical protein QXF04_01595 [Candidatus Aenigmatarchaeota archaeon]
MAQAGEKYWGAVTALLNAIGKALGMSHYSHRDCQFIKNGNSGILIFKKAEGLHANTTTMDKEVFEEHRKDVLSLIEKLRRCLSKL